MIDRIADFPLQLFKKLWPQNQSFGGDTLFILEMFIICFWTEGLKK